MTCKNNCAAGSFKLLNDNILICELSGEAIRGKNQYGFNLTLRHSISETIQGGPIQASAAQSIVLIYMLRANLIIVLPSVFLNGSDLRGDVFIELLFGAGDSGIKGCDLHHFPPWSLDAAMKAHGLSVGD